MLIIKLQGGLGNQLFQYAFGRRLALIRQEDLLLDEEGLNNDYVTNRRYSLAPFNIKAKIVSSAEVLKFKYPYGLISKFFAIFNIKILRRFNIGWNELLLESKKSYFEGFFQSYKYLEPIREQLLKEIALKEPLENKYIEILNKIATTNSVSIHVRRGDYVNNQKTKAAHYTFGLEYYVKAVEMILTKINKPTFYIFSDDISWVKENLKIDETVVFVSNSSMNDYEELMLMSRCQNNIIANSSFSFWGAWLNQNENKIVIAPQKWNNIYVSEYQDLLPPSWLKI